MAQGCACRLRVSRRRLLMGGAAFGGTVLGGGGRSGLAAPGAVTSDGTRPQVPYGVMSGDPTGGRAIIWSKTDRPARMLGECATREDFRDAQRVAGPAALAVSDYTARVDLGPLPPGSQIFYRVTFQDLADLKTVSAPAAGMLRMPGGDKRNITFAYSGDEAGQGWGINPEWGGYKLYEMMRQASPDFFIHSGDQIYADGPIAAEVKLDDGTLWKNLTTEAKSKVAESLAEYRGAFAYNLMDEHKRRFMAEVPFLVQWDDHETRNNWYPGQILDDPRYKNERSLSLLSARGKRAMFEYNPFRFDAEDPERIYRAFAQGPLLDVFMLDDRSYRGPNTTNVQTALTPEAAFLRPEQMRCLERRPL